MAAAPADLVFDPTHAVREVALRFTRPHALLSGRTPDGLTSRPHHAPRRFGRITWTALPATGIGLQPQTRRNQPPILYSPFVQIARKFFADFSKDFCFLRERYLKEALRRKKVCSWKGKKRRITAKHYEFHKKCRKQTFYAADSRRCITVVMLAYPAVRGDLHDREPTFTDRCLRGCPRQRQRGRSGAMP